MEELSINFRNKYLNINENVLNYWKKVRKWYQFYATSAEKKNFFT